MMMTPTLRRLLFREILFTVSFVTLAFLALFIFFDFIDQLSAVGRPDRPGFYVTQALVYVLLLAPGHLYELLPITVLIGTIYVMTRLAQSSEFTILRTSGLGPWRALVMLLTAGGVFAVTTFAIGDYFSPWANQAAQTYRAQFRSSGAPIGKAGAWLREREPYAKYGINIGALLPDGSLEQVRIYEIDNAGYLVSTMQAPKARINNDQSWTLLDVERTEFNADGPDVHRIETTMLPSYRWPTNISQEMIVAAVLDPDRMNTVDLFLYIRHLEDNAQNADRYEIQFWKKVFYPLSCLVMVMMALPFAYLHFRSQGISLYVFGGVMAGVTFFFLNSMFGYIGELRQWTPWIAAATPGLIFMLISLAAFAWLVLKR
ncbi:LPS export ABC transporter permease LptG [Hylemonella gracilis]|uniref:LPS export ABC transporter permease LptG n=1 Tax=Hylemonella gracilis TaxID=80880 RepID=A0A4V1A2B5_9BURK|nr:LPS export ABC transporter permease LptG [Hylemonella gracilis]QBK05469.1 LPS export ABC transporter permease LptG [Hylemonella gracilis]